MSRRLIVNARYVLALCVLIGATTYGEDLIREDIVYVDRDGIEVSYDVVPAAEPNGSAVLIMSSGGWFSAKRPVDRLKLGFGVSARCWLHPRDNSPP